MPKIRRFNGYVLTHLGMSSSQKQRIARSNLARKESLIRSRSQPYMYLNRKWEDFVQKQVDFDAEVSYRVNQPFKKAYLSNWNHPRNHPVLRKNEAGKLLGSWMQKRLRGSLGRKKVRDLKYKVGASRIRALHRYQDRSKSRVTWGNYNPPRKPFAKKLWSRKPEIEADRLLSLRRNYPTALENMKKHLQYYKWYPENQSHLRRAEGHAMEYFEGDEYKKDVRNFKDMIQNSRGLNRGDLSVRKVVIEELAKDINLAAQATGRYDPVITATPSGGVVFESPSGLVDRVELPDVYTPGTPERVPNYFAAEKAYEKKMNSRQYGSVKRKLLWDYPEDMPANKAHHQSDEVPRCGVAAGGAVVQEGDDVPDFSITHKLSDDHAAGALDYDYPDGYVGGGRVVENAPDGSATVRARNPTDERELEDYDENTPATWGPGAYTRVYKGSRIYSADGSGPGYDGSRSMVYNCLFVNPWEVGGGSKAYYSKKWEK